MQRHGDVCVGGLCEPRCNATSDCPAGDVCSGESKTCIPDPSRQIFCSDQMPCAGTGQMCAADGYCYYACMNADDCQLIDVFFTVCDQSICMTDDEANPECTHRDALPRRQGLHLEQVPVTRGA